MDLYTNFYESSSDNDSDSRNNNNKSAKRQLRHKADNTFVYESLPSKLSKVKIRFNERIDNDYIETKFNEIQGEVSYSEKQSNFRQILEREKTLNNSSEYSIFYYTVNEYAISYVYVVNNYKAILSAISKAIEVEISSCKIDPEAKFNPNWNEKKLKQLNNAYILALLDLIVGVIKDLREYCYEFFVDNNLEQIIQLIKISSEDSDMLDQLFSFFVNVFRLLQKSIAKNFNKMLIIYSELLFNKNKFIRKFAAQSLCFVIKNLEKEDLIKTFQFLIDFIYHPEKLLEETIGNKGEMKDVTQEELYQDKDMSKVIIYKALGGDSQAYLKLFIIESLSELIKEILSNGKFISQMSDLILAKLASNGIIKNDIETILLFILSFIKLSKRVQSDKSRYQVIALFHYFLIYQNDITANYAKLKLDTLVNQLSLIKSIDNHHQIRLYLLIFAKELMTKNFKIQDSTIGDYIQMIISRLSQFEANELELSLIIEITALIIKFYPKMSTVISYRKIFAKGRESKVNFLLRLLIKLNQFAFYQAFSLYSTKQNDRNDHDQYDIISYDKDTSYNLFNHYLLNGISSLDYDTIVNIITTYDRLFIADIESVQQLSLENEDNCSYIIAAIGSISIEELHLLLLNFNVISYSKIYIMLRLIKDIQLRNPNEFNKHLKPKVNQIASECLNQLSAIHFNNEEILSHIFLYEFYNDGKFFLEKAQGYLAILLKCKEITNVEYPIKNPQYSSYGLYIQLSQSISNQITNHDYRMLLSGNNTFKRNYLKLYRRDYPIDQEKYRIVIEDIFNTMETILIITFDYQNDKKYSINYEVLLSKMELLLSDGITISKTDLVLFVFYFCMGSHWITLTKSVWVALAKGIERLFTFYVESPIKMNKEASDDMIYTHLITNVNELLQFIQKFPSEADFISKSSAIVKKNFIIFDSHTKNNDFIPLNVQNIAYVLTEINSSEFKTISTFFNGISTSLSTSYGVILNYNKQFRDSFINDFISICKIFSNRLDLYHSDKKYNECLSLFYNYILDKETKSSSVHLKLKEGLFTIVSKLTELTSYYDITSLQSIIFEQIILSKSTQIQHLSVEIIALYNSHIVPYKNLLSLVIDTSSFIIQLSNLAETKSDDGQIMKLEERASLIPVLTRLHYSKYFSLSSEGGKLKTKHKINLVNFFIQLEPNEFEEYINIIFEPLNDVLMKGIWYFDMRTYKKILEILRINLKQITSLFKGRIDKLAQIITSLFVFIKQFGERIKKDMLNVIEEISNEITTNTDIATSKYYAYYDKDELATYTNFFLNNIKDLRKESFTVFEMIFNKFYTRTDLLQSISNDICREYNDNLTKQTSKINSIYKFFLSFSRHAKLHFIYRSNPLIMHSFMQLISNPLTERRFLINIIEFVENLLSVYPDMESEIKIEAAKQLEKKRDENIIIEEMDIDSIGDDDNNNILDIKDDQPIDNITMNDNYQVIIKANFDQLNSALVALISNDKIRPSIKDNITLRVIDILLTLWRLTQSYNLPIVKDILSFLLKIFEEDKKIFKEKEIMNQVLHLCHILIIIQIKGNTDKDMESIRVLYQKFLSFLFKIENFNSRLLLAIILQEFGVLSTNLASILELITYLNKNKTNSRAMGVELDDVAVIEKLNVINEGFLMEHFDNLEPLIYQLIILSSNDDFAIASLSLDKLFLIARCISQRNAFMQYTHVLKVMFDIIKNKFSYAKIILETLSEMNTVNQSHIVCNDLFTIKPIIDPNNEDVNPLHKLNFLKMILNFKYDIRIEALQLLQSAIASGQITKESLNAVVIPIMRNFLNYKNYSDTIKTNQKLIRRSNAVLTQITTTTIELIKIITPLLNEEELKELLLFFFGNLQRLTKEKQKEVDYTIDIMKMTNKTLTVYIECVIAAKFSKFDFVKNFNEITKTKINVKEDRNIRTIFYTIFTELKARNLALDYHNDQLYHILCKNIYPTLKGMLYDMKRKEGGKYYYIKNYIIQPFISIVKINSPLKSQNDINQLSLELINNLANLDASIREKAREGIEHVLSSLGEYFSLMFFDNMKTHLHSGYQRHVLGYTVNYILQQINSSDIYEICIDTLVPILLDELFGDVAEEKEIDILMSKYKEAKTIKGFNSFELISKHITLKTLMESVLIPLKNFLIQRENTPSVVQRCNEVINGIVRGLKNNTSHITLEDIIEYSYSLIHICIEKNLQNAKAIKKLRNVEIKGNDIFTLSISNDYSIEIANTFIKEKNNIIYSNLFATLGLELLQIAIKGRMIYQAKIEGNDKVLVEGLNDKLTNVLTNVVICLKMSNNTILVSKSIRILISLFDCKLLIIKKNLMKITKSLFKNLLIINPNDIPLTQAVLSGISDIFTKFSFVSVANDKIKQLLDFLKLHINQSEIKPYVFSCILAIVKKKIIHPSVYDIIDFIREIYLISFEENTLTVTQGIIVEFLLNYPIEHKPLMAHINYWIINMESNTRRCRFNAIKMILFLIKKAYNELKVEELIDFLLLKLFTLYSNCDDHDLKILIEEILTELFQKVPNEKFEQYYLNAIKLISPDNNSKQSLKSFALCVLSLILNNKFAFLDMKSLDLILTNAFQHELNNQTKELEEKIICNDFTSANEDTINVTSSQWSYLYQLIILIEKIQVSYDCISSKTIVLLLQAINHPHSFIKSIGLRLINNSITLVIKQVDEDIIAGLMRQLKFIIMNNSFEDKVYDNVIGIVVAVASCGLFTDSIKELIEGISNDSKKWISNKDKDKGLAILQRVTTVYSQIILNTDEQKNRLAKFAKPMIDFCYRVGNNTLADNEIKTTCEIIMNEITIKMKKEDMTKLYKEVTSEISYLKKKRKMEQVEKFKEKHQK